MSYTKLFSSIVTSTIWTEDASTCKVWVTMLAIANKHGEVHASIPGLAQIAGMRLDETEAAIDKFLSPDKYSRTPDDEGRRIEPIEGGWLLLNHAKYRAMASKDEEKLASARRQAAFRDRRKRNGHVTDSNGEVTECNGAVTPNRDIAEADTKAEAKREREDSPAPADWKESMSTSTANQFDAWTKRINSMHPKWRTALIRSEMDDLMANAKAFDSLEERDWKLLAAYMDSAIPSEWGKFWQPDRRSQFIRSISDILGHADTWERECKRRNVSTGVELVGGTA